MLPPNHAVASVWGLIALRLADDEIIPFNYVSYTSELEVPLLSFLATEDILYLETQGKTPIQYD